MIRQVSVENQSGDILEMPFTSLPTEAGITVLKVDGLEPPLEQINTLGGVYLDGSRFNYSRAEERNIVLSLAFRDVEIRDAIYGTFFPAKEDLIFRVTTDLHDATIIARTEENDMRLFHKILNTDISLICTFPYFKSTTVNSVVIGAVTPAFIFPFANTSLTEPTLIFGYESTDMFRNIVYPGHVPTGVVFTWTASGPSSDVYIHNVFKRETLVINMSRLETAIGGPTQANDKVIIDTRAGEKTVTFVRGAFSQNVLHAMERTSDWIKIYPRINNVIVYEIETGLVGSNLQVDYDILLAGL